jgi:hypothetical protein
MTQAPSAAVQRASSRQKSALRQSSSRWTPHRPAAALHAPRVLQPGVAAQSPSRILRDAVLRAFIRALERHYREDALARGGVDPKFAAVSVLQRFDGAVRAHVHWHVLAADGAWVSTPDMVMTDRQDARRPGLDPPFCVRISAPWTAGRSTRPHGSVAVRARHRARPRIERLFVATRARAASSNPLTTRTIAEFRMYAYKNPCPYPEFTDGHACDRHGPALRTGKIIENERLCGDSATLQTSAM